MGEVATGIELNVDAGRENFPGFAQPLDRRWVDGCTAGRGVEPAIGRFERLVVGCKASRGQGRRYGAVAGAPARMKWLRHRAEVAPRARSERGCDAERH